MRLMKLDFSKNNHEQLINKRGQPLIQCSEKKTNNKLEFY